LDYGFEPSRKFGRGQQGGQVRDEIKFKIGGEKGEDRLIKNLLHFFFKLGNIEFTGIILEDTKMQIILEFMKTEKVIKIAIIWWSQTYLKR
jgi:hypothetical protein